MARALDMGAADYLVKTLLAGGAGRQDQGCPTPERDAQAASSLRAGRLDHRLCPASGDPGRPVPLTDIEYRAVAELSVNAGWVLTYKHLLRRVWRVEADADVRPMHTAISSLRRKLGDDAEDPAYVFTELRVGYQMPKGGTEGRDER